MTRILAAAALGLASATALNAQTIPAEVTEPVTITFYNYNLASAGIGKEATEKMIAEFEAANPLIDVVGVPVSAANFSTIIQADIVAGKSVDLSQMVFSSLDFAINNLQATALEDIIPQDEIDAHTDGMAPNGIALGQIDGKTYGLAYTFSTPVLYYNADIFRAAGLDPDQPPKTWDEVKAAGEQILAKTDALPLATGIFGPSAGDWLMQGVLRSNNGPAINAERTAMTFAEPNAVEAVTMLRDLAERGILKNLDIGAQMEMMGSGNAAMYLQTSAIQGYLVAGATGNYDLRASTMPTFGDKPARPNNSGSALVIHAQDPMKQRAAWELMQFLTSEHGYTIITSEIGYLPLRPEIVNDPAYLKDWVAEHPLVQPNLDQLALLEPWVPMPGPNYSQIVTTMMDAMEQAVFGKDDDVTDILAKAQKRANRLIPAAEM